MREGSGRGSGRVRSDFLSAIAGWIGSGQRFAGSGRVQEKWPVDNSGVTNWTAWYFNKHGTAGDSHMGPHESTRDRIWSHETTYSTWGKYSTISVLDSSARQRTQMEEPYNAVQKYAMRVTYAPSPSDEEEFHCIKTCRLKLPTWKTRFIVEQAAMQAAAVKLVTGDLCDRKVLRLFATSLATSQSTDCNCRTRVLRCLSRCLSTGGCSNPACFCNECMHKWCLCKCVNVM